MKSLEIYKIVLGLCIIFLVMSGCHSRLHTRIISEDLPSQEVAQHQESLQAEDHAVEELKIASLPGATGEGADSIPVEPPPRPVIRDDAAESIFATPPKEPDETAITTPAGMDKAHDVMKGAESPLASAVPGEEEPVGLPSMEYEPELPPMPMRRDEPSVTSDIAATPKASDQGASREIIDQDEPTDMRELGEEPVQSEKVIEIAKLPPEEVEVPRVEGSEGLRSHLMDVYFDYDRFALRPDDFQKLSANADVLVSQLADRKIVLEGHCDERGTESYNMVLGKRRARTVKDFLVDLGVPKENLSIISYGKEKPFCMQQTQECWQENRRVHFGIE